MKLSQALMLAALLSTPLLATAHQHDTGTLHIDAPWSREMPPTAPTAAVYFTVKNTGDNADRLLSVETPAAGKAELHEHLHKDGLMKMQQVPSVVIPAKGEVAFAPMGYHVMLFNLPRPMTSGEHFPLTLNFEQAGKVQLEVPVLREAPGNQNRTMHHQGH